MAIYLPNGSKFYIASTIAATKTFTSITNASEAVMSFAADPGLATGDYFEINSGWEEIDGNVYRVKTASGAGPYLVTIEGLNTTDTARFPSGSGAGTTREVTAWTEITQVEAPATSGGEQQFITYQTIALAKERRLPSYRNAQGLKLTFFDDPALGWYSIVQAASVDNQNQYPIKISLKSGAFIVASGYWSLQKMPQMASGSPMKAEIDIALANDIVRYAS